MWYKIIALTDWFGEIAERYRLVRDFNKAAKNAYISGEAETLLEARITRGDSAYKHSFSKFLAGGLRIKALTGKAFDKQALLEIGDVVLENDALVRKLVSLGWDTLEVHSNNGSLGIKWPLKKYTRIGGMLN